MNRSRRVVPIALAFESALGLAGWALCAWQGVPLASRLVVSSDVLLRSVVASAPMFLLLAYVTRSRWQPLVELRTQVEQLVGELFRGVSWLGLAAVAIAAGVGEELLFRGALQPLAERWWGLAAGLVAVSLLFGLVHAVSPAYFLFATIVGFYLGWLSAFFDDLVAPIVVHAAYDFAALQVLRHAPNNKDPNAEVASCDSASPL
ncbi:MAG: CPBP family intramembrane metalloprotease [Pirellulales bacterium]|nr:CPBP family intramembrane metalloprotease [Pirellulales bacterium]